MPPDVVAKAFDPFFTTKPVSQGTGLGLSMIYGFARQSGGDVRLESEPGRGTTVRLVLPLRDLGAAEPAAQAPTPAPAPEGPRGSGETVLGAALAPSAPTALGPLPPRAVLLAPQRGATGDAFCDLACPTTKPDTARPRSPRRASKLDSNGSQVPPFDNPPL